MIADALKHLAETAVKAAGQRIVTPAAEPPHIYYRLNEGGQLVKTEAEPRPVAHAAGDLAAVAAKAADAGAVGRAEVWFDRTGVVALLDAMTRRDRVSMALAPSVPLLAISAWATGTAYAQVELVRLLRTTFADCLNAHPDLRKQVGQVDIKKAQQAAGTVDVGKVSISRSMIAEASGADRLPEVLAFDVPVFDTPKLPVRATVRVAFDLDPQTERFRLVPLPGQVEAAFVAGEEYTRARLHDAMSEAGGEAVPVYYGKPS